MIMVTLYLSKKICVKTYLRQETLQYLDMLAHSVTANSLLNTWFILIFEYLGICCPHFFLVFEYLGQLTHLRPCLIESSLRRLRMIHA